MRHFLLIFLACVALSVSGVLQAAEARVAVASNFSSAMVRLATDFEAATGHQLKVSYGSTGKLFAQISNGAPFDLLLAADARRPRLLVEAGLAVMASRRAYAVGRLLLCGVKGETGVYERLRQGRFRRLAIANPVTAPYGEAAQAFLEQAGLWSSLQGRLVRGENIAQTFQFVASGSTDLGLIAATQRDGRVKLDCWPVPADIHRPVSQELVLLRRGADNPAALALLDYLGSAAAQQIILRIGYDLP